MGNLQSVSNDPPVVVAPAPARPEVARAIVPMDQSGVGNPRPVPPVPVGATPKSPVNLVAIVTAALILGLFAWLFDFMLETGVPSKDWDRYIALFNSVQSIVAAATGALLGAQVSAGQAVAAKAEGAVAKARADRLESNIKSFQADVAKSRLTAEAGDPGATERLLARTMTLLH